MNKIKSKKKHKYKPSIKTKNKLDDLELEIVGLKMRMVSLESVFNEGKKDE